MKNIHLVIAVAGAIMLSAMPVETYAQLLEGTSGPGMVYAYQGGTNWTAISPSLGHAATPGTTGFCANAPSTLQARDATPALVKFQSVSLQGGYVAGGVGMRNRGFGHISISAIPAGSTIYAAYLYWDILGETVPDDTFSQGQINGQQITGQQVATGGDPCWGNSANFAYRADVTSLVTGNGTYSLSNFASGITDGTDPWTARSAPMMEGASLVIIYENSSSPPTTILIYEGAALTEGDLLEVTIDGFTAPTSAFSATTTFIGADGQEVGEPADCTFNGHILPTVVWDGRDPQDGPTFSQGNLWDTMTVDVTSLISAGDTSATATVQKPGDCIVWIAQVFSINSNPFFITPATGFDATGCIGGPFSTTNETFSLTNIGTAPLNWSLANTSSWLDASPSGGTLAAGGTTNAIVSLSSNAYSLSSGFYTATVWFTNLNDGDVQSRQFTLAVIGPPVITCPGNIVMTTPNPSWAVVNYTVTVSGGCPPITTNCVPASGSVFPIGTTTVNCCATDSCGQSNCCSFTVTVTLGSPAPGISQLLLAGTSGPGMVYAYQGGTNWTAISPSLGDAVMDIIQFNGTLYAATESDSGGEMWRYDGGTNWTIVEDNMDDEVCALEIYKGQLYASTAEEGGNLYCYNGTNFVYAGTVANFSGIRAMHSSSYGNLQLGDIGIDMFGRYDGTNFYYDTNFDNSGIVDFAEYNNKLYAGTEECAQLFGSTNGINWSMVLDCPNNTYALWELAPFQGQLYLGYDNGQLAYMDSSETWNSVLIVSNSIISMVAGGNTMLYFGTGAEAVGNATGSGPGYVYAYTGNGATSATQISGPMGDGVQCLYGLADPLQITPAVGFTNAGCVGGPFSITNETFLLINTGTNSLTWSLANTSSWLDASPGGGTLAAGGTTNVTVSLNSNAYSLPLGVYTATAWFTNLNDGIVQSRQFTLTVGPNITTQPAAVTVATNGMGVFSVVATGDELGYQWYQNGTPLADSPPISGSQTNTLIISPATPADAASYYVIITNSCGDSAISITNGLTLDKAANLTWRGNLSTNLWDVGLTADWTNGTAAVVFNSGDNVMFDDTALTNVVNLANSYLAPSSIKVTANSKIYTFKGIGSIVGTGNLIMSGSSTLTNEVANSYTGGTIITNKGTICLAGGPPALNGLGSGTVTLAGGTLDFGTGLGFSATAGLTNTINVVTPGTAGSSNLIVMEGTGTQGAVLLGTLTGTPGASLTIYESSSMGRLRLYAPFTNSLNINISSYGYVWNKNNIGTPYPTTLQFAPYNTNASQVYNGVISGDGQIIARNSSGSEVIFNNTNTFMGYQYLGAGDPNVSFVLSQCNVGIGVNSITNGTPALNGTNVVSGPLGVGEVMLAVETSASSSSSSGTLFASGGARTLHNLIQYLAGTNMFTFRLGGSNNLTLAGGLELAAPDNSFTNRIIEVDNTALTTESGVIDDGLLTAGHGLGCPITITSSNALGTLVLSATNTYTGPTTVSNGTLLVNGLIGTNTVAAVTVAGGTLGGSGTIRGPVTVLPAGTLAPGTSAIGTLILSNGLILDGNLLFKVNTSLSPLQSNDEAVVSGTLINGGTGTLTVSNLGTTASLVAGDKFTLFNKALTNGLALTVAGGGTGVTWTNNLAKDGSISVASITVARPVITGMVISSGTNLVFSGTNSTGTAGGTYYVLSSINVASPLSTWTPILTNTFITGGAFSVTNPILPGVPGMFYILELP